MPCQYLFKSISCWWIYICLHTAFGSTDGHLSPPGLWWCHCHAGFPQQWFLQRQHLDHAAAPWQSDSECLIFIYLRVSCVVHSHFLLSLISTSYVEFNHSSDLTKYLPCKEFSCVSLCALIPVSLALLQLWMSDHQTEGEGDETEQATEKHWTSEKNKKNTFFTSHQPKLCVWLCLHIHAQICMFTLHSQCVKYSMCVQIHWSVFVNCMSTSTEKRMERFFFFNITHCVNQWMFFFFFSQFGQWYPSFRSESAPCSLTLFTVANCCCCRKTQT